MMKDYSKALVSLAAGCLLVLCFAPFAFRWTAFLSTALLLWCLIEANPKEAAYYGFLFGLGFFSVGVYWIFISIHTYGEAPVTIGILITVLFIVALSLFLSLMSCCFSWFRTRLSFQCLAIFPALWVIAEWCRSWVLTGFPWLFLGYSQVDTTLRSLAPFIGVYGLSFLIAFISGCLVLLLKGDLRAKTIALVSIGLIALCANSLDRIQFTQIDPKAISVSLIQGNIPQSLKWNPEQAIKTLKTYSSLTRTQASHSLLVWPEAAIPVLKSQARTYLNYMDRLLKRKDQILITGIPIDTRPNFYNGILMLGKAQGEYLKVHLVPFGEYYPVKWLIGPLFDYLKIPMSDLSPGPDRQALLNAKGLSIAAFVCYEIAYPQQVLEQTHHAELLVTLSDDSWFGDSIAAAQHLEIAQLRALETQRYLLFSTNSGISAVINPKGEAKTQLGLNQQGIIHTQIHAVQGLTPLMKWGYAPLALLILLLLMIGLKIRARRTY